MSDTVRTCKTCKEEKPLSEFDIVKNKKLVNESRRHHCAPCMRIKRKDYLKKYHKTTYIKKGRPKKYSKVKKNVCCPECQHNFLV